MLLRVNCFLFCEHKTAYDMLIIDWSSDVCSSDLIALAVATSFAIPSLAYAQSTSPHSLSGNMSLISDYRFRGLSQTFEEPALQGEIGRASCRERVCQYV